MAYGIKSITGHYVPNGSGRDWNIVGDFEYRNGRKTPDASATGFRGVPTLYQPRTCAEVEAGNLRRLGAKTSQLERWAKRHAERGEGHGGQQAPAREEYAKRKAEAYEKAILAKSASAPAVRPTSMGDIGSKATETMGLAAKKAVKAAEETFQARQQKAVRSEGKSKRYFESTSWNHGQIPGWQGKKYVLPLSEEDAAAGVPRGPCSHDEIAGSGDHTRGIVSSFPHFHAEYHKLGKVEVPGQEKRLELSRAADSRRAGVYSIDPALTKKAMDEQKGEMCCGIHGRLPHHKSVQSDLGYDQGFVQPEKYAPDKYHGLDIWKDKPNLKAKKAQEGDECLGIKTGQPHFRSTYSDLGNIADWPKSRYNFGNVATANYRFTVWRD
eukprot:TRINITY_DN49254_c0_g1_i1.p1 TRINITY_DN49254_c0_g1~~TRINITY_DN49254_c0_g1_i1.p1  ORF type:complete len:382 (+),score=81.92 TRINITY_DN49254_c0_g1_i1:39-1184(+)